MSEDPNNLESRRLTFAEAPDARRRNLFGENAAGLYNLCIEKLRPLASKFGPTPAQVNTPLPWEAVPRDSACCLFQTALGA